eukprot:TRINITY_DN1525_c0_g1_i1.p1 TRINITY_DN1525_c0_g1~~TRINITY_DN1525_c0_g1_i1.p1  ORF type:complete len:389 (+),score=63.27 TRINITY_DN1525_c0_g1_i1:77-1168(+)
MARFFFLAVLFAIAKGLNQFAPDQLKSEHGGKTGVGKSKTELPDVAKLLPSRAFAAMKLRVAELRKHLAGKQRKSIAALQEIKAIYDRKLDLQMKNNSGVQRRNLLIASRTQLVQKKNVGLRLRAMNLMKANDVLRSQLDVLSSNLSLAQEFAQEGLAGSTTNASEIQVLSELAEQDEVARTMSRKHELLGHLGHASAISLIGSAGDVHERSADHIMDTLSSSLEKLSIEANMSKSLLQTAYEKQLAEAIEKHDDLIRDQFLFNKSNSEAEELRDRLSAAVKSLSEVHDHLLARVKAVKAFAFRIGSQQTSAEKADGHQRQDNMKVKRGPGNAKSSHTRQGYNISKNVTQSHVGSDGILNRTQ